MDDSAISRFVKTEYGIDFSLNDRQRSYTLPTNINSSDSANSIDNSYHDAMPEIPGDHDSYSVSGERSSDSMAKFEGRQRSNTFDGTGGVQFGVSPKLKIPQVIDSGAYDRMYYRVESNGDDAMQTDEQYTPVAEHGSFTGRLVKSTGSYDTGHGMITNPSFGLSERQYYDRGSVRENGYPRNFQNGYGYTDGYAPNPTIFVQAEAPRYVHNNTTERACSPRGNPSPYAHGTADGGFPFLPSYPVKRDEPVAQTQNFQKSEESFNPGQRFTKSMGREEQYNHIPTNTRNEFNNQFTKSSPPGQRKRKRRKASGSGPVMQLPLKGLKHNDDNFETAQRFVEQLDRVSSPRGEESHSHISPRSPRGEDAYQIHRVISPRSPRSPRGEDFPQLNRIVSPRSPRTQDGYPLERMLSPRSEDSFSPRYHGFTSPQGFPQRSRQEVDMVKDRRSEGNSGYNSRPSRFDDYQTSPRYRSVPQSEQSGNSPRRTFLQSESGDSSYTSPRGQYIPDEQQNNYQRFVQSDSSFNPPNGSFEQGNGYQRFTGSNSEFNFPPSYVPSGYDYQQGFLHPFYGAEQGSPKAENGSLESVENSQQQSGDQLNPPAGFKLCPSRSPILDSAVVCAVRKWGAHIHSHETDPLSITFSVTDFELFYNSSVAICSKENPTEDRESRVKAIRRYFVDFPVKKDRKRLSSFQIAVKPQFVKKVHDIIKNHLEVGL